MTAVDAVSFAVEPGEMFGLIGPDGAGKTTSIRMACGLLRADGGQRRASSDAIRSREHRAMTGDVGYLSQRFSLYGDLSIDENIAFFAEIHGVRHYTARRDRLLEMTQLTPFRARRADRLSGGMKQKLALACTLVHEPKILLLDEPTTGVDPVSRREFWKLLSEFLARGLTIVMSTPYLDEAERCGRVALLHDGRLLAIDRPAELQARLAGQLLEVSVRDAPSAARDPPQRSRGDRRAVVRRSRARPRCEPAGAGRDVIGRGGAPASGDRRRQRSPHRRVARGRVHRSRLPGHARPRLQHRRENHETLRITCLVVPRCPRRRSAGARAADARRRDRAWPGKQSPDRGVTGPQGRSGGDRDRAERRVDAVAVLSWRLHANQSRPGVCDSAARRPCARRLSRYPGQLPGTARSGLACVFSGPNRCPGTSRRCGAQGHRGGHSRGAIDLRLEITRAFWALVSAIESERVVTRSLDTIGAHVQDLRSRFDQGLIAPNDVLTAETQQSRERGLAIEAKNLRGVSEADLRRLIGVDAIVGIEPVAVLENAGTPSSSSIEGLLNEARTQRAERRALEDRLQASRAREEALAAEARPQVGVNAGYDYASPNSRFFPKTNLWHDSWDASVNLSVSIWDGGRRGAHRAEAVAASHAVEARTAEFDRQVSFEVQQRRLEVDSSRAAIEAAADGVRSAVEAQRVVMERFRAGVVTNTDVLDANLAVLQAELDLTRARANAHLADARLERAVGR